MLSHHLVASQSGLNTILENNPVAPRPDGEHNQEATQCIVRRAKRSSSDRQGHTRTSGSTSTSETDWAAGKMIRCPRVPIAAPVAQDRQRCLRERNVRKPGVDVQSAAAFPLNILQAAREGCFCARYCYASYTRTVANHHAPVARADRRPPKEPLMHARAGR